MAGRSPSVLYVIPGLYPAGVGNHLLSLSRGLVDDGWDVTVAYLKGDGELAWEFEQAGCDVVEVGISRDADPVGFLRLVSHLRARDYDLVHTHLFRGDVYGSIAATVARTGPVLSTKHNNAPYLARPPYKWLHNLTVALTDQVITISDFLQEFYAQHTYSSTEKFETVHYGLDPGPFEAVSDETAVDTRAQLVDDSELLVGSVARLIEAKGIDVLLSAFAEVRETGLSAHLAVVGEGPEKESLRTQCHGLGIMDSVTFTGFRSDVPELMNAFDLFVLPSRREGFGLVLLEAMAASTPVVAARTSAIPEVVDDGQTGTLVPVEDVASMAAAIRIVLESDNREAMGTRGRERVAKTFSIESMVESTKETYLDLLSR